MGIISPQGQMGIIMDVKYPRRAVTRGDFDGKASRYDNGWRMSCNYFQQDNPNEKWVLHLADGSLINDPTWVRPPELVEEFLRTNIWIELIDEKIAYMDATGFRKDA